LPTVQPIYIALDFREVKENRIAMLLSVRYQCYQTIAMRDNNHNSLLRFNILKKQSLTEKCCFKSKRVKVQFSRSSCRQTYQLYLHL